LKASDFLGRVLLVFLLEDNLRDEGITLLGVMGSYVFIRSLMLFIKGENDYEIVIGGRGQNYNFLDTNSIVTNRYPSLN
jgi:hypothetical protein